MPSSLELINLKLAFGSFDPKQARDAEAMHILQECVRLNYSPPEFLLPYVGKAVEAWGKTKGNKTAFKATQDQWDYWIWHAHFYFITGDPNIGRDKRLEQAIEYVIEQHRPEVNGKKVTFDTLKRYYDEAEGSHIKDDVKSKHRPRIK